MAEGNDIQSMDWLVRMLQSTAVPDFLSPISTGSLGGYKENKFRPVSDMLAKAIPGIAPLLPTIRQVFDPDKALMEALMPGYGSAGSFLAPTNHANSLLNKWATKEQELLVGDASGKGNKDFILKFLESTHEKSGYGDKSKAMAKKDYDDPFSPMGWAAKFLVGGMEGDRLREGLGKGGTFNRMHETRDYTDYNISDFAEMEARARGGETPAADANGDPRAPDKRESDDRSKRRRAAYTKFATTLTDDYLTNISQYGGLRGGDIGDLVASMGQRGAFSEFGEAAGADAGGTQAERDGRTEESAKRMKDRVKKLAQALAPLKEVFNVSVPEALALLDDSFGGVDALSTFAPGTLQDRALKIKHTAAVAGTTPENIQAMSAAGKSYLEAAGGDTALAGQVGLEAASALGARTDMKWLDQERFAGDFTKRMAAAKGGQRAKDVAGAFVAWEAAELSGADGEKAKKMTREERYAKFENALGGDTTLGNLLKVSGVASEGALRDISSGEAAREVAATMDTGTTVSRSMLAERLDRVNTDAVDFMKGQGYQFDAADLSPAALKGKSMDQITNLIKSGVKGSAQTKEEAAGSFLRYSDAAAQTQFKYSQGYREMLTSRDKIEKAETDKVEVAKRAEVDKLFSKAGVSYGLPGMVSAWANPETKADLSTLLKSGLGLQDVSALTPESFTQSLNANRAEAKKQGRADAAASNPNAAPADLDKAEKQAGKAEDSVQSTVLEGYKAMLTGKMKDWGAGPTAEESAEADAALKIEAGSRTEAQRTAIKTAESKTDKSDLKKLYVKANTKGETIDRADERKMQRLLAKTGVVSDDDKDAKVLQDIYKEVDDGKATASEAEAAAIKFQEADTPGKRQAFKEGRLKKKLGEGAEAADIKSLSEKMEADEKSMPELYKGKTHGDKLLTYMDKHKDEGGSDENRKSMEAKIKKSSSEVGLATGGDWLQRMLQGITDQIVSVMAAIKAK